MHSIFASRKPFDLFPVKSQIEPIQEQIHLTLDLGHFRICDIDANCLRDNENQPLQSSERGVIDSLIGQRKKIPNQKRGELFCFESVNILGNIPWISSHQQLHQSFVPSPRDWGLYFCHIRAKRFPDFCRHLDSRKIRVSGCEISPFQQVA